MRGEAQVIERLNEALFLELGAVNQYWVHYRLLNDWGVGKLADKERAEIAAILNAGEAETDGIDLTGFGREGPAY